MLAWTTRSELGAEGRTLNLVELAKLSPGLIADRSRNVDFQPYRGHGGAITRSKIRVFRQRLARSE